MADNPYLLIGKDNSIRISGLQDAVTENYINDATVTVELQDLAGNAVAGQSWPLTLLYESGSNGVYNGVLAYTLALTENAVYKAIISANGGGLIAPKIDYYRAVYDR